MTTRPASNTMERIMSTILLIGIIASSTAILIGLVLFLVHSHQDHTSSYHQFTSTTYSFSHSIAGLQSSIRSGEGIGLIELGVLLLILTPILRVAASILLFKHRQDKPMMLVTLFVFFIVTSSFILGLLVT